jgi:transposase
MSTSLLYHAFGVRGYQYVRQSFGKDGIEFTIEQDRSELRCSACGSSEVQPKGRIPREFKTLPIGGKPVSLAFEVPRVECRECGCRRQVKLGFADPRVSYTRAFARYALELSRHMTIQDVADHLLVSWDVIKEIQRADLQRRFARPKLKKVRQIAIDEISVGKGHRYMTLVLDLESGAVLFVGDGKGADALLPFWRRLRASGAKIRAVATDMSLAYIAAVSDNLKGALHVFDHFHIIKLYNEKLTDLRRALYREVTDLMHKKILKGTLWLLLKNPENLDPKKNEQARLDEALEINAPLFVAYYMKEQLRQLWSQENKRTARSFLNDWIALAQRSGIRMLMNFAKTLTVYREGILNYYDYRISTGPLEGTNNKIKTMKRQAYGFRDHAFFKLKIMGIHETRYELVG